jgi:hypothetical protein
MQPQEDPTVKDGVYYPKICPHGKQWSGKPGEWPCCAAASKERTRMRMFLSMASADIVLASYDQLQAMTDQPSHGYASLKSFMWWRCVLDEIQQVDTQAEEAMSKQMKKDIENRTAAAMSLQAVNRWAVSGTPIETPSDMKAILQFLRHQPFADPDLWARTAEPALKLSNVRDDTEKMLKKIQDLLVKTEYDAELLSHAVVPPSVPYPDYNSYNFVEQQEKYHQSRKLVRDYNAAQELVESSFKAAFALSEAAVSKSARIKSIHSALMSIRDRFKLNRHTGSSLTPTTAALFGAEVSALAMTFEPKKDAKIAEAEELVAAAEVQPLVRRLGSGLDLLASLLRPTMWRNTQARVSTMGQLSLPPVTEVVVRIQLTASEDHVLREIQRNYTAGRIPLVLSFLQKAIAIVGNVEDKDCEAFLKQANLVCLDPCGIDTLASGSPMCVIIGSCIPVGDDSANSSTPTIVRTPKDPRYINGGGSTRETFLGVRAAVEHAGGKLLVVESSLSPEEHQDEDDGHGRWQKGSTGMYERDLCRLFTCLQIIAATACGSSIIALWSIMGNKAIKIKKTVFPLLMERALSKCYKLKRDAKQSVIVSGSCHPSSAGDGAKGVLRAVGPLRLVYHIASAFYEISSSAKAAAVVVAAKTTTTTTAAAAVAAVATMAGTITTAAAAAAAAATTAAAAAETTTTTPPPPTRPPSLKDLFLDMVAACRTKLDTSTHPRVGSVKLCFDEKATILVADSKIKEADSAIRTAAMISLLSQVPNTILVSNLVQELKVSCAIEATELKDTDLFGITVTNLSCGTYEEFINSASQHLTNFGMERQDIDKEASKAAVDKQIANAIEKTIVLGRPMPRHGEGTVYIYFAGIKKKDKYGIFQKELEITYAGSNTQAGMTITQSEKARTDKRKADKEKTKTDSLTRWARERRAKAIENGEDPNDVWLTRISISVRVPEGSLTLLGDAFGVTQVMEAETIQFLKRYDKNINKREVTVGFQGMTSSEAKKIQCYIKCSKGYKLEEYYNKEKVIETLNETGTTGWIISATGVVTLPDVLVNKSTFNIDKVIAAFAKLPGKSVVRIDIGKLSAGRSITQQNKGFFKIKVEVTCKDFEKVEVQATLNKHKQGHYLASISGDDFKKLPDPFKVACPSKQFRVRQAVSNQGFVIAGNTLTDFLKITAWTSVPPSFNKEKDKLFWTKMKSSMEKGGKNYSANTLTLHYKTQTITATYSQKRKKSFYVIIPLKSRSSVNKKTANPELVEAINALKEVTDKRWRYFTTNLLELPPNLKDFSITKP